jgi:hypothetical protein
MLPLQSVSIEDQPARCRLVISKRDGAVSVGTGTTWPVAAESSQ